MNILMVLFFVLCVSSHCIYSAPGWVDIPILDYKMLLGMDSGEIGCLNERVKYYHSIDKSSLGDLPERIRLLESIHDSVVQMAESEKFCEKKSLLKLLESMVQSKKEYLQHILEIPADEIIARYHLDYSLVSDSPCGIMSMRNTCSYSMKMKEFWGAFWLESIDPCHRRLANYYQFWLDTDPELKSYQSFFLWLETQYVPQNIPMVSYYSEGQLAACCVEIVDGYLVKKETQEPVSTCRVKRNIFVMDLSQDLYIEQVTEGVWHSSLSCGKPVLGAGLMEIERGIVKMIALESGHYLPSIEQGFQFIKILMKNNARIVDPFELIYFENGKKYIVFLPLSCLDIYKNFDEAIHDPTKRQLVSSNEF